MADEIQAELLKTVLADFIAKRSTSVKPSVLTVRVWGDQNAMLYLLSMGEDEADVLRLPIRQLTGRAWTLGTSIILYDQDVQIVVEKLPFL